MEWNIFSKNKFKILNYESSRIVQMYFNIPDFHAFEQITGFFRCARVKYLMYSVVPLKATHLMYNGESLKATYLYVYCTVT